jgi:hypothetical protein
VSCVATTDSASGGLSEVEVEMGYIKGFFALVGAVTVTLSTGATLLTQLGFSPTVGPEAANAALAWFGDPCDGVEHPAYMSQTLHEILDGVREARDSDELFVVQVAVRKDDWAYVEASPYQGGKSGQFTAYILSETESGWSVNWHGAPGARPGQHDYPAGFDDNLLRCKEIGCSAN